MLVGEGIFFAILVRSYRSRRAALTGATRPRLFEGYTDMSTTTAASHDPFAGRSFMFRPSWPGLAYLLRHKALWPPGFGPFDYKLQSTCAVGLGMLFWGDDKWLPFAGRRTPAGHRIFHDASHHHWTERVTGLTAGAIARRIDRGLRDGTI